MKDLRFESWLDHEFRTRNDEHWARRGFHFAIGTVIAFLFLGVFSRKVSVLLIVVSTALFVFVDLARLKLKWLNIIVVKVLGPLMRREESSKPTASLFYMLGLCFAISLLPRAIAIQAIFTLAWMDPVAALFGLKFGRHTWRDICAFFVGKSPRVDLFFGAKTFEGSFAGFTVAFLAGVIAWTGPWAAVLKNGSLWWPDPKTILILSLVGAITSTIAEAWPSQWDDNINIPFWTGLVLWATTAILNVPLNFI